MQELVLKKLLTGRPVRVEMVAKVQLKIACMIAYYTLLGVISLVLFTYTEVNPGYQEGIREHILCESGGQSDCVIDLGISYNVISATSIIIFVMLSFLPVFAILFSYDPKNSRAREKPIKTNNKANERYIKCKEIGTADD